MILFIFINIIKLLLVILPALMGLAFLTYFERKILAIAHRRYGPNVVGLLGLLQAIVDGVKLIVKESVLPELSGKFLYILAPTLTFFLSLMGWLVIPFEEESLIADINLSILYIFGISSLAVYSILIAGWSSNSRYALLGGLRSAAQMVSYEVSIGIIILTIVICVGSLNLIQIVLFQRYIWFCVPLLPMALLFFISAVAETNRPPFDLPEAEAELVSGYNVEYGAIGFAMFFMGEYGSILMMSSLIITLFFGGWLPILSFFVFIPSFFWFTGKLLFILFFFVWIRAAFPRFRYDQLMRIGWKVFLPISLGFLILTGIMVAG